MTAIDDLRFIAKRFAGVIELLPTLEGISSVENHLKELRAKRDWVAKEVEKEREALGAVVTEAQNIRSDALASAAKTQNEADKKLADAESRYNSIVEAARVNAEATVNAAKAEVAGFDKLIEFKTSECKLLESEAARLVDKVSKLNAELAWLKAKI